MAEISASTVKELREGPKGGFGWGIDAVLHLSEEEKYRVSKAFWENFIRRGGEAEAGASL